MVARLPVVEGIVFLVSASYGRLLMQGACSHLGAYKRDVSVVIQLGADVHRYLLCIGADYPEFAVADCDRFVENLRKTFLTGTVAQFNVANIDKWRDVFTGMVMEPSQIEFQKPVGEGKLYCLCYCLCIMPKKLAIVVISVRRPGLL